MLHQISDEPVTVSGGQIYHTNGGHGYLPVATAAIAPALLGFEFKFEANSPAGLSVLYETNRFGFIVDFDEIEFFYDDQTLQRLNYDTPLNPGSDRTAVVITGCYFEDYYGDAVSSWPQHVDTWIVWVNGILAGTFARRHGVAPAAYICAELGEYIYGEQQPRIWGVEIPDLAQPLPYFSIDSGEANKLNYETLLRDWRLLQRQDEYGKLVVWKGYQPEAVIDLDVYATKAPDINDSYSKPPNRWRISGVLPQRDFRKGYGNQVLAVYQHPYLEHVLHAQAVYEDIATESYGISNSSQVRMQLNPLIQIGDIIDFGGKKYIVKALGWEFGPQIRCNLELCRYEPQSL